MRLLPSIAVLAISAAAANAAVLSSWTFETNTPADVTDNVNGPSVASEAGLFAGSFSGTHASAASDWTTPSGNGSANSYSGNNWAVNDYFQASTSSVGYEDLVIGFDAIGSSTGPRDFKLAYSTGGGYTDVPAGTYQLIVNATPNNWSSGSPILTSSYSFNLSAIAAIENAAIVRIRFINTSTTSTGGGTTAAAGTSRIDNVSISATAIPEPASLGLLGLGALAMGRRRRA